MKKILICLLFMVGCQAQQPPKTNYKPQTYTVKGVITDIKIVGDGRYCDLLITFQDKKVIVVDSFNGELTITQPFQLDKLNILEFDSRKHLISINQKQEGN